MFLLCIFAAPEHVRQALWDHLKEGLQGYRMDLKTVVHYLGQIYRSKRCLRGTDIRHMLVSTQLSMYTTEQLIGQLAEIATQSTHGYYTPEGTAFHTLFVDVAERLQPTDCHIPDDCDDHVQLLRSLRNVRGKLPVEMWYPYEKHLDMLLTAICSKWQNNREYAAPHLGCAAMFMYECRYAVLSYIHTHHSNVQNSVLVLNVDRIATVWAQKGLN